MKNKYILGEYHAHILYVRILMLGGCEQAHGYDMAYKC